MWIKTFLILILCSSCANFSLSSKKGQFRPEILKKFENASSDLKQGKSTKAGQQLNALKDNELNGSEKSAKYNLLGVISFNQNDWAKAEEFFIVAMKYSGEDSELQSKINLNLASVKFKKNEFNESLHFLEKVKKEDLPEDEREKSWMIQYLVVQQLDRPFLIVESGIHLLNKYPHRDVMISSDYFSTVVKNFQKLTKTQKFNLLNDQVKESPIAVSVLAEKEVMRMTSSGELSEREELLSWMSSELDQFEEVRKLVQRFNKDVKNNANINDYSIGVVLPLTGEKENFGKKALMGIEMAISKYEAQTGNKIKLFVKDDQDQVAVGELMVEQLIQQERVAFVIGGLFSNVAKAEFLQAKKEDTLFISLSQIILPFELKTNLLFEIPGSIESQVETIFSESSLNILGKKIGLIYPDSDLGQAYLDAVWAVKEEGKISITSVAKFKKDADDQREPVMFMLGLKNPKERQQELNLWTELSDLEGQRAVRKIQTLPPVIDFDWIFMAANPQETQKLIPTFKYFDALDVTYVGSPSWQSKGLVRGQPDLGKMFFSGIIEENSKAFSEEFFTKYQVEPGIVAYLSFEAFILGSKFLENASDRSELVDKIHSTHELITDNAKWINKKGLWLRDMGLLQIDKGNVVKAHQ